MLTEDWTTLVFRNGVKLDLPQTANSVIDQMALAGKVGTPTSFVTLKLRDEAFAVVFLPEIIAVAARALSADGNVSMLQSTRLVLDEADRVTEVQKDADGKMIGAISRVVRA